MKNIIQKVSALALMAFTVVNAYAQNPTVTLSTVDIAPGEEKTVSIFLADDPANKTRQFQATVTLPSGFEFVKTGNAYATAGDRATTSQTVLARSVQTSGDVQSCTMGLATLGSIDPFDSDTTKSVLNFIIKAPESFPAISTIKLSNIVVVGLNKYQSTESTPYSATGIINNSEAPRPTFTFAGSDTLSVHKGDTTTVTLNATWPNSLNVQAGSGTITLPEGLSFVKDGNNFISFNSSRFSADQKGQNIDDNGIGIWTVYSLFDVLAPTPEELGTFTIAVDPTFEGSKNITATYEFTDNNANLVGQGSINLVLRVIPDAPTFAVAPDTLKLNEGETGNIEIAVNVPEGTKPSVNGAVTLPEGLTFAEGDGTFNLEALETNDTVKVAVKAGKAFEGAKEIAVAINATSEDGDAYEAFADTIAVTVAQLAAPSFVTAPDTLKLTEGAVDNLTLAITVPEGTKPTVAGTVTLPEELTFVEGDGTFNLVAEKDTTITFAVKAGKAFADYKDIAISATATSEAGTVYDAFNGVVAVSIAAPEAPTFAFAETDSLALEEDTEATIAVNITIPEGTELSNVTGTVTLPTGVSFSNQTAGIVIDGNDVNINGNTATWTATPTESGVLLTLNIHTNQGFKDGVVKVEATATSKEGTTFDTVTLERSIGNKTAAGINSISVDDVKNYDGPIFNMAGQRVNKSYKGIVIINGKKVINK